MKQKIERHLVLVRPEIHWNTGNVGRTCLGAGAYLHLIKPLGFSLNQKEVKRAGLDYWDQVKLKVWDDFDQFLDHMNPAKSEVALFSKIGSHSLWKMNCPNRMFLIFGSETKGLPRYVIERYPDQTFHIPITRHIRSLNLSTAAGIALYETLRESEMNHDWPPC